MDISMDIHVKSVDMDMAMDGEFKSNFISTANPIVALGPFINYRLL